MPFLVYALTFNFVNFYTVLRDFKDVDDSDTI